MNKWIKSGMTGLIIGAASFAAVSNANTEAKTSQATTVKCVDAFDLDGGSKLKDRMLKGGARTDMGVIRILIDA